MSQTQNEKDTLLCTHGNCKTPQTADGEFCEKHYPRSTALRNPDYCSYTDDSLVEEREYYLDLLEANMSEKGIENLHELLEIERELTLREE